MIFLIDILLIASGIFMLVYGGLLFRFTLALAGFALGFSISMWLLAAQPDLTRILISLVVGAIVAILGYFLIKMALHIAGGILGIVLVLLILSILPFSMPNILSLVLILAGSGVVGFFGRRLGDWIIILATAVTGAYVILLGLAQLFPAVLGVAAKYGSAQIPLTLPAFFIFIILLIIGTLSQFQLRRVRGRYVNL